MIHSMKTAYYIYIYFCVSNQLYQHEMYFVLKQILLQISPNTYYKNYHDFFL